jgi:hypothetical protein
MPRTKTPAVKTESPAQKLEKLKDAARAIHEERYSQNEAWNARLADINGQISELEGRVRNEEAAGGA